MKNHTQNMVEKLFPDCFLKNQHFQVLYILLLLFARLRKVIKTELKTTFLHDEKVKTKMQISEEQKELLR